MKKLVLNFGGHPLKNDDFNLIQAAYAESFKAIISIFDPTLNVILSGFVITDDNTNISCSDGYVSWQGEIYQISSTTFTKAIGQQLFLKLVEITDYPSPVQYKDETYQISHVDRKLELKYYASGDSGEYLAGFTRTSSLGFKRGMLLDFVGNVVSNFDLDGLGINDMAGFAVCNGNTFTISGGLLYTVPDLRGRSKVGAYNVPNQGAPTYDSANLGFPEITQVDGKALYQLAQNNLPSYTLPYTETGHTHFTLVNESFSSGNFPYEVGRAPADNLSAIVGYGKTSGGGKESYIMSGASLINKPPDVSPSSSSVSGIIINSGGTGVAFDNRGGWYGTIPIIKL